MHRGPAGQGPVVLDRAHAHPLWRQLYDDLLARVARGEFPDRFPGEMELTESYGVSRHTVREALRRLRGDGLVESSRGRSSVARPSVVSQHLGALHSLSQELASRGIEQRTEVLRAAWVTDVRAADQLGLPPDTALVHVQRILRAGDEPIAWEQVWLDPEVGRPLLRAELPGSRLQEELQAVTGHGPTGGRESIRAVLPTPQVQARLEMVPGEPALEVERIGCAGEQAVEVRVSVIRGGRCSFRAEWSAGEPYPVQITLGPGQQLNPGPGRSAVG